MRRLIASVVLVAVAMPVGWAYADSVRGEVTDCQYVEVHLPDYEPSELRVCKPETAV